MRVVHARAGDVARHRTHRYSRSSVRLDKPRSDPVPATTIAQVRQRMTFAEVFLRLGSALVAWVVVFAHCIWLAALHEVSCGAAGPQPWGVLLGFSLITLIGALALPLGATVPGVAGILKYPAVPLVLLVPLSARHAYSVLERVNFSAGTICNDPTSQALEPRWWEAWFGPTQLILLAIIVVMAIVQWRKSVTAVRMAAQSA